jgi:hypothetical protein
MIRRRFKLLPRRFSKNFIASELTKRNKYRQMVRSIQNDTCQFRTNFPFDIYTIISIGTVVRAYCKTSRTIQRGKVILYDKRNAVYLIKFENKAFRNEYCPDSEVATCGSPSLLVRKCVYNSYDDNSQCIDPLPGELFDLKLMHNMNYPPMDNLKFTSTFFKQI